jgi:L-arabinose isomerase
LTDFAEMAGIECTVIDAATNMRAFRSELKWNDIAWRLH